MLADHDPMEDLPFARGVTMSDWTGMAWKEIPPERVAYIVSSGTKRGKIISFLSKIPVGEGRKRDNIPDLKTAKGIRNTLYRASTKVWGAKSIKIELTKNNDGTYMLEFVHIAPEDTDQPLSRVGKPKAWKEEQRDKLANDPLYNLCAKHQGDWATAASIYNALKRGEINTVEELKNTPLEDIAKIRMIGQRKLAIISEMKREIEHE